MTKRKTKYDYEELYLTYTSLEDAHKIITDAIERFGKKATLEIENVPDYGGERIRVAVCYERPETDGEMASRLKQEEMLRDHRRKTYEALKREFGDS